MLPLVLGMKVALTSHLDRSTKALLRGRSGVLVGWQLDPRDESAAKAATSDYVLQHAPYVLSIKFSDQDAQVTL